MAKYSVFMTDSIFPDTTIERGELSLADAELTLSSAPDTETLIREGQDCDAMMVVYAQVDANVISKLTRCKVIVRLGIGFNNIDLEAASKAGIMVANVPDYCLDEVADHTMALVLAVVRRTCFLNNKVGSDVWSIADAKPIPRLRGKVFGLFGCGAIGQQVGKRASAFGMEVIGYDPYAPESVFAENNIRQVADFDEFLAATDVLSLHMPLTDTTRHIINRETIAKMKRSAYVINTSRGGLIEEGDLYEALVKGDLAGAGLDVLEVEPPVSAPLLSTLANTVITPHAAFFSEESVVELRKKASQEVIRTLEEGQPKFCVNR